MAEKGYMIVADISGYTQFLSDSELDHAQEILTSLINAMLEHIDDPLILARVEGDAIFAYTKSDCVLQGQTLLESLEHIYFRFLQTLESNVRNTTCKCNACANMDGLNLKMVIHHGEFGLQKLGTQIDLVGSDVNLTHRLLKNHIIEETKVEAYAFISKAAIEAMMIGNLTSQMIPHKENYDHLGDVHGFVYDLKPVWDRERERRRVYVSPNEAELSYEFDLSVPPMLAWDYINEPESRARYRHSDSDEVKIGKDGRLEVGTVYHCAHGDEINYEMVLDWKPFEYVTVDSRTKSTGFWMTTRITIYLKPTETGTHVNIYYRKPVAENKLKQIVLNGLWKGSLKNIYKGGFEAIPIGLKEMIEEDKASGRLSMRMISAGVSEETTVE
jgi:hypothetical protein